MEKASSKAYVSKRLIEKYKEQKKQVVPKLEKEMTVIKEECDNDVLMMDNFDYQEEKKMGGEMIRESKSKNNSASKARV